MAQIKNSTAYFAQMIKNSLKNEYRQNDNEAKHTAPSGLWIEALSDQMEIWDELENAATRSPESWLLLIESQPLHRALSSLPPKDLELIFRMFVLQYEQKEIALMTGLSKQAVSQRYQRILKNIKKFF